MIKNLKDTVGDMLSDNHIERLIAEYDQTQFRLAGLYDLLKKNATLELDHELDCDVELLKVQAEAMETYLMCLAERLSYYADDCDCDGCDHAS